MEFFDKSDIENLKSQKVPDFFQYIQKDEKFKKHMNISNWNHLLDQCKPIPHNHNIRKIINNAFYFQTERLGTLDGVKLELELIILICVNEKSYIFKNCSFTIHNIIFLNESIFKNLEDVPSIVKHELVHIYQRYKPEIFETLLKKNGFIKDIDFKSRMKDFLRTTNFFLVENPDQMTYEYKYKDFRRKGFSIIPFYASTQHLFRIYAIEINDQTRKIVDLFPCNIDPHNEWIANYLS